MRSIWLALVFGGSIVPALAQQRILHFTATSGFDHNTRSVSYAMFGSIGADLGVEVDDDATGGTFSDASALGSYSVIVFSNTSGNAILDDLARTNFEAWVANGGRVMGIHAASDTYRHSTANGNNTGTWDYYAELLGGSVQENPNHVSGTPLYAMQHIGTHASTTNLPDPWVKNEEYYYWEGGYYGPDNTEVLRVEETVGPNGQVNSFDAPRPMSWYREQPNGTRVFYTALGHAPENFTDDPLFRDHIRSALVWLMDDATMVRSDPDPEIISVFPNPTYGPVVIEREEDHLAEAITVMDGSGRVITRGWTNGGRTSLLLNGVAPGNYILSIGSHHHTRLMVTP